MRFALKLEVKWGSTRIVLLVARWAIKLPAFVEWRLFLLGLLANMQERNFSTTGWQQLCPVLWSLPGGWIVVMPRARAMTREEFEAFDPAQWCEREGYVIPAEPKMDSFGWVDGKLVAIDYGN